MTDQELEEKLRELVLTERKITNEILLLIVAAEERRLHLERGYGSLFEWLVKEFKYSESAASRRISAARLMRVMPEVQGKLEDGSVNLSTLARAQISVKAHKRATGRSADVRDVVHALENKTLEQADEILAQMFPESAALPSVEQRRVGDGFVRLTLNLPTAVVDKLEKIRNKISHKQYDANLADVIAYLADVSETQRFAAAAKRRIIERAGHCEYVDEKTGRRCTSTYQLEVDHIVPRALGGSDAPENLRCLCRAHNQLEAEKKLGFRYQSVGK